MLDENKRNKLLALLANGSSRRMAARYVGCSPSTITRIAAQDPVFSEQLTAAEQSAEIDALRAIRAAARKDRYWHAAWILERRNPDDFAKRQPTLLTADEVSEIISQIVELLQHDIPEENCERALEKMAQLLELIREAQTTPAFPKSPVLNFPESESPTPNPEMQHPTSEPLEVTSDTLDLNSEFYDTSDTEQ